MKRMRRITALLLTLSMVVSLLGTAVFATEDTSEYICGKEVHQHSESCYVLQTDVDDDDYYATDPIVKKSLVCGKEVHTHDDTCLKQEEIVEEPAPLAEPEDTSVVYDYESNILYLTDAELTEGIALEGDWTVVVSGDCSIDAGEGNALSATGSLTIIEGENAGSLALTGVYGLCGTSVSIEDIDVDIDVDSCGIYVYNDADDAIVTLDNVDGSITGGYAGIYVNGECAESDAAVVIEDCDLETTSTATSWNSRARKAGIAVYVSKAEKVESSISIEDSKVIATGYDAGLSINNYLGDADATNSASSTIDITNSIVVANSVGGTWAGIFASVLGMHPDADSIITITDSSVYAVSPNTGILTSSQKGESKIILDNSILGAEGKTALSMIEATCQAQAAELKNGSTYVQMTPDAVMKGEIVNFDGKTIIATAGDGISYDEEDNYFVIPQGSAVTESFTDGTSKDYTFNNQAGGVGGFDYEKEEIWGYDIPVTPVCRIVETGEEYETLTAAVADANALGTATIEMLKDIDFDSTKALSITGDVTIIGEYTISRGDYTGTLFTVPAGASLTLDDGIVFDGSNEWIFNKELYEYDLYNFEDSLHSEYAYSAEGGTCGKAAAFVVNGTVTANDATFQNFFSTMDSNAGDAAIFKVNANATLTTDGALINHCATYGANTVAHLATNAKWYIKGDTMISNNFGGRNGGMCRNDYGQIYMSGGTVKDNAGKNVNGSFIMMYGAGSAFYMTGGTICGNSSTSGVNNGRCAAVYLHTAAYMKMTGGSICHNIGGARGGIDSYKTSSVLDINRVDQYFEDGVYPYENGKDAYTASNHPVISDNISLRKHRQNDVGYTYDIEGYDWWVTGGIYTQDVDEFCAKGYICIPYEDSERTDDYIVVPGYRVKYFSVEEVEVTDAETNETTTEIQTTLEKKYFHMLPRDKFWYEMDEKAESFTLTRDDGATIDTWFTEKELQNVYDFSTKLESDLDLYGEWVEPSLTIAYDYNDGMVGEETKSAVTTKEKSYNPSKAGVPAPAKDGYILAGWKYAKDSAADSESKEDTGKWYMGETLTTDTRFIAQWIEAPEAPEKKDPIPVHLGTKWDELKIRNENRYTVNIDVPGAAGITGHDEVIMMVDGSYSLDQEWPKMKEAIIEIAETVLNDSGTTQLTLMAFGMGDNEVIVHAKSADEVAAKLGELPGTLLYGRSSTNCEAGFTGVANYIRNHDNTLNNVDVIYISDGNINTDETPRAFAQNWKTWATKYGPQFVAEAAFEETMLYGENVPAAFTTLFGDRFAGASRTDILRRAFGGEVTAEEFIAFADQVWMDVYAYSGLSIGVEYPVSVAERAFVKYDKEHGTYIQDAFYYTTYKSSYVGYGNGTARAKAAAEELAAMDEVRNMYVVDYDSKSAWMDTGITNEKSTFILSTGIAGLLTALDGALVELSKTPINDPVITDYMSKWVNLDATTLKIIDNNTGKVLWTAAGGWAEGVTPTTAKNPPVKVELVDPADYAAGGDDVIGNTSGDIYKLTWYLKDGALLRSDDFRLSYEVTVDTKEAGFVYEKDYPANGNTFIEYKDDEGKDKGNDIEVPDVNAFRVTAALNIHKVNDAGAPLAGAEFEVRDAKTNAVITTGTTDAKGNLTLELEAGDHILVETKAPAGYMVASEAVEITVSKDLEITVGKNKTATYDGDILNFVNQPPHAAVVLTIDMSGTMYRYKMGGKRYVDVAKAKALEFVEDYAASAVNGSKRMLAVARFDTDAQLVQNWIDVSTASGLATAKKAINAMKVADNGSTSSNQVCTNFDGGVILTRNLLKQSTVKDIDRRFAIILSDGAPTVTVNSDTNTVGTIKSSFWGNQLNAAGTKYQNKHCGGGWTHPGEVDRTLNYLNGLKELTYDYNVNGEKAEGIFLVGVGGDMSVKLFNDAIYGTSNGTRTSDVKKNAGAFDYVPALEGFSRTEIKNMTTAGWLTNLADRVDGTYVSAADATALQKQFQLILNESVKTN